jgi:hypothetical protein
MSYNPTPYSNVGNYKGWTGLSPPTSYPYKHVEYEANKGNSSLDTTSTLWITTLILFL